MLFNRKKVALRPQRPEIPIPEPGLKDVAERYITLLAEVQRELGLGQPLVQQRARLERYEGTLLRLLRAFECGFGPIEPPRHWFCGVMELPDAWGHFFYAGNPTAVNLSRWPCQNPPSNRYYPKAPYVFQGYVPRKVQHLITTAAPLLDDHKADVGMRSWQSNLMVYSPRMEDFRLSAMHADPIAIGIIDAVPDQGRVFLEIGSWDLGVGRA